jgi:hypothetical protein
MAQKGTIVVRLDRLNPLLRAVDVALARWDTVAWRADPRVNEAMADLQRAYGQWTANPADDRMRAEVR